ncbi:MAG: cation:dicarboxylase symporter family transporter [Steroidobacteraceae bacterium]
MLTAFSINLEQRDVADLAEARVAENDLGLPRHVSRFVLTLGATANQNGTALFEGITVLFLAQFYGVPLDLGQQGLVLFICTSAASARPACPPARCRWWRAILGGMIGVPVEGIGLVLGVDRLLDMCRTTVNVSGDLAIAAIVSRGEPADARSRGGGAAAGGDAILAGDGTGGLPE